MGELNREFKVKLQKCYPLILYFLTTFGGFLCENELKGFIFCFHFSAVVKLRHRSNLVFQFTESQKLNNFVSLATLNIFVHGKKSLKSSDTQNVQSIDIEIAKVLQRSPHKRVFETFHNISFPESSDGDYLQFNITELVAEWFASDETSHVMAIKIVDSKTGEILPHKIISLESDNYVTVSIVQSIFEINFYCIQFWSQITVQ